MIMRQTYPCRETTDVVELPSNRNTNQWITVHHDGHIYWYWGKADLQMLSNSWLIVVTYNNQLVGMMEAKYIMQSI